MSGLVVICGATATGKTGMAIALAKALSAPIINADSRQIYKYFDIGTAKPDLTARQGVPHYLIDIAEPDITLTLAEYQEQTQALIQDFHRQGITPILVGGTGLYIKSIIRGLKIPRVKPDPSLRSQLETLGQQQCHQMLQKIDPNHQIHANDQFRTLRALEVYYVTGRTLSSQQGESPPTYPIWQIGINTPELSLYQKIVGDRLDQMLEMGWLREIQFIQAKFGKTLPLLRTLGYREMSMYLDHEITLAEAKQLTFQQTMRLAKQQKTWFQAPQNNQGNIFWCDREVELEVLLDLIHDCKDR